MSSPAKKRESASERDERLVREAGPWDGADRVVYPSSKTYADYDDARIACKAAARILNRIAKGKKGAADGR